ncbi:hypothetical protein niasHS_001223 [Heterodera schachtii]
MALLLLVLCSFLNIGETGPISNVPQQASIQPASSILHQMGTDNLLNNNNINKQQIEKERSSKSGDLGKNSKHPHKKESATKKPHRKLGVESKVKVEQKRKSKNLSEKKGRFGKIMFYVFMLITIIVPHVPQNVTLNYNNGLVPIEPEYMTCSPYNGNMYKCEFSVDEMEVESDNPNIEILGKFNDNNNNTTTTTTSRNTLQLMGKKSVIDDSCKVKDGKQICDTQLEINADQMGQLRRMLVSTKMIDQSIGNDNRRKTLEGQTITLSLANQCDHPVWVFSNAIPNVQMPVLLESNHGQHFPIASTQAAARLWVEQHNCNDLTDDEKQKNLICNPAGADKLSLFEWTFDGISQFIDVSYVDGANVPMGVHVPEFPDKDIIINTPTGTTTTVEQLFEDSNGQLVVPSEMIINDYAGTTKMLSLCSLYNTDETCCRNAHQKDLDCGPQPQPFAGGKPIIEMLDGKPIPEPITNNGMNDQQLQILNAYHNAFPNAYAYAYDDPRALQKIVGATEFVVAFCANAKDVRFYDAPAAP